MRCRLAYLALACALPACTFDPSGLAPGGPPDARTEPDARPAPDAAPPDAGGPCGGESLALAIAIDGESVEVDGPEPVADLLVGDVVELSAAGSCSADGVLNYQWEITPDDGIRGTADPNLRTETFTIYPANTGIYTVDLTIMNSTGTPLGGRVELQVHGWQPVAGAPSKVLDLDTGGGNLWLATEQDGAHRLALGAMTPATVALDQDELTGDSVDNDLNAVFFDERTDLLWLGRLNNKSGAWKIDTTVSPMVSTLIDYSGALSGDARVRDIAGSPAGIMVATNNGITQSEDGDSFTGAIEPDGEIAEALATGAGRRMAGSKELYDLDSQANIEIIQGGGDDKIRTLAIDAENELLWAGTDDNGLVQFDLPEDDTSNVYTTSNSGLGSDRIRALAVETEGRYPGDVWAATDKGVARYIRRRQTWVHMDADHGLSGHTDVKSIAVDVDPASGRRAIYAGTEGGLVYSRIP